MTPEERVMPQVFIESERKRSAGDLEVCGRLVLCLAALACAPDAEEWISAALREAGQLTAGESNAIDFRKRICKERYARNIAHSGAE
jgi:hypothetical protein